MKLGDIVRYRNWKVGDPDPESISEEDRAWGTTGLVIAILHEVNFKNKLTSAAEYIDENGDIYCAATYDLEIVG